MNGKPPDFLYRYTTLSAMLQIVEHSAIYLTDPEKWPDKNDTKQLLHYHKSAGSAQIRAFCLSETSDSLTHWGQAQCCIQFKGPELFRSLDGAEGVLFKKVRYKKLIDLQRAA
ncbi:MAG: hypothetical protein LBG76_00500 [Treponema sp.]|jgi:hypothetical protein|nr:hypothetical protein [Treponema sp.]